MENVEKKISTEEEKFIYPFRVEIELRDLNNDIVDKYPLSKVGIKVISSLIQRLANSSSKIQIRIKHYGNKEEWGKGISSKDLPVYTQTTFPIASIETIEKRLIKHMEKYIKPSVIVVGKGCDNVEKVYLSSLEREDYETYDNDEEEFTGEITELGRYLLSRSVWKGEDDSGIQNIMVPVYDVDITKMRVKQAKDEVIKAKEMDCQWIWYYLE